MGRDTSTKSTCFFETVVSFLEDNWCIFHDTNQDLVCMMLPLLFHILITVVLWVEYTIKIWLFRGTSSSMHFQHCFKPQVTGI